MISRCQHGEVHLATHLLSRKKVVIKFLEKACIQADEFAQRELSREIKMMRALDNTKVLKLLEVFENEKFVYLVTEYINKGGDLLSYMRQNGVFREADAKPVFAQILAGLEYCHSKRILHRDIKLDSILVDDGLEVKLGNFRYARLMEPGELSNEKLGTPAYTSPEIVAEQAYQGFQADVWSLGILVFALTTGTIPFKARTIPELEQKILNEDYRFPSNAKLSEPFKDLVNQMLIKQPEDRIKILEIWEHEWLQGFTNYRDQIMDTPEVNLQDNQKLVELGFEKDMIEESLQSKQMNHITATHYLIYFQDQN